jgi:pyruvate,water dikinase
MASPTTPQADSSASALELDPTRGTSRPDRYWTTTNIGEAAPDVLSPMCWSVWGEPAEQAWIYSMQAFGVLPRSRSISGDVNAWAASVFYGRLALNVDSLRETLAHLPGVKPDDFERDLCGSVRDGAPTVRGNRARVPVILVKGPRTLKRQGTVIRDLYASTRTWWERDVLGDPSAPAIDRLVEAHERFCRAFAEHVVWRFIFSGAQTAITDAATRVGEPLLATQLMSGAGDVLETRMTQDIWRLSRDELTEAEFLRLWGYHGPNEGNTDARVWREDPTPVRSLVASYRQRPADESPLEREARSIALGREAEQKLLAVTSGVKRPVMRWLMRRVRNIVRTLQIGKASYLMCIDGVRRAARDFGAEQVAAGTFMTADDVFYLSVEECARLAKGELPHVRELIQARRGFRTQYRGLQLPVFFHGMPEPTPIMPGESAPHDREVEISGAASGGGRVEGRARILLDPYSTMALDAGDILVCRFTDPSWAPLMALSEALVIDIGGSASHGAVVARELGIPYVIGTGNGTTAIRDGDRIVVDGEKNIVRVLAPANT